ncbi:MAG: aminomethyl-transferring glycine dehydrogenase subunit GcvPA [Lachnospiraceae bacterium]|jgi:glycine cleavage system pyridoxal-binding protein P|nr:aminomethyl-transferring glycine dehydrogenase subunit GcvPA [Lachnospiraceae bacterium]
MGSYIPATGEQEQEMLGKIGVSRIEDLFAGIPAELKVKGGLDLPDGVSEMEALRGMRSLADRNRIYRKIFRGAGAYDHYIPAIVSEVISKESFLTAYTPYQAEISQGVLQSIFEYQTYICELTGMDVSNACVYDGAEAAAEAAAMCRDRGRTKVLVSGAVSPYILSVVKTYCFGSGCEVEEIPAEGTATDVGALQKKLGPDTMCLIMAQPNYFGTIEDAAAIAEAVHAAGAKLVMSVDPVAAAVLRSAAEYGADIAVGEGQPLGMPLSFGGPYLGFMATKQAFMRRLPGRIVGETKDRDGKTGYVLTLQAREQHIRREKASSNICSNEALCALCAGVYLSAMGPQGIADAAQQSMSKAHYLSEKLAEAGFHTLNGRAFFNEFVTDSPVAPASVMRALSAKGILGGLPLGGAHKGEILWCATEKNTKADIEEAAEAAGAAAKDPAAAEGKEA